MGKGEHFLRKREFKFIRKLAKLYNVRVQLRPLEEGVRGYKMGNEIVLNDALYPERRNWTFCHELAHILLGHSAEITYEEDLEADKYAAELMLPESDFIPESKGLDLVKLKNLYPYASYEVLARRCIQFQPAILTIFDQQELTLRIASPEITFPPAPTPDENMVMKECYLRKENFSINMNTLTIDAYYIDEGRGVIRVILISQPELWYE
jgi:Zn-dependent peptidase ImmA (M78 family)